METAIDVKAKRILLVEDDKDINHLIYYNLSKRGYEVDCVYDGISAKEKLTNNVFDVVILDVMLPGINGFKLCEFIKSNTANFRTFVVLLTARAEPLDKIYGNVVGADYYMTKPFSISKLMDVVRDFSFNQKKEIKQ